mgnify:CR=1 FL=1
MKKGKVIAVMNRKGGVGKTTLTANLGAGLARKGKKILLIDADGQGSLSGMLSKSEEIQATTWDAMTSKNPGEGLKKRLPLFIAPSLALVCSDPRIDEIDTALAGRYSRERILRKIIREVYPDWTTQYDAIIIDCPPSAGLMTMNALTAADLVLIPTLTEYMSLEGIGTMRSHIEEARDGGNPDLKLGGVVLMRFTTRTGNFKERNAISAENALQEVFDGKLLETRIHRKKEIYDAPGAHKDIFSFAPGSRGASDFEALTEEIIRKFKL